MIIVLNGPLGIGKSTLAEALAESIDRCVMLDGDHLVAANPPPVDGIAYLHATIALLIEHNRRFGYRHFVVNHLWRTPAELDDLRHRLLDVDADADIRCFLLTLPLDENLRRIQRRQSARALDEQEFDLLTVEAEREALFNRSVRPTGWRTVGRLVAPLARSPPDCTGLSKRSASGWMMIVAIRLASEDDAGAISDIYAPVVSASAISFELEPPDAREMARRIRETMGQTPWIVCTGDGDVLGYAYAGSFRQRPAYQWTVEVSAYVTPRAQGSGVGRALYTSLLEVLRLQGYRTALAVLTLPNPASEGLHRAMGFTSVGIFRNVGYKLGAWHDVAWLEMSLLEHAAEPPAPIPLPRLPGAGLRRALRAGSALVRNSKVRQILAVCWWLGIATVSTPAAAQAQQHSPHWMEQTSQLHFLGANVLLGGVSAGIAALLHGESLTEGCLDRDDGEVDWGLDVPGVLAVLRGILDPDQSLDLPQSVSSGAVVFVGGGAIALPGTIHYHRSPDRDRTRYVLAHERVHLLQYDQTFLAVGKPAESWMAGHLPDLGLPFALEFNAASLATALALAVHVWPVHDDQPWEREAMFLGRARQ
jgi:L-amino acid N-acyltransferase YncA